MPYARPTTMHLNGVTVLESRFSSAEPSIYGSSTQNDDRDQPQTPGASWQANDITTWQHNVSTSFAQLSKQFQAASHAVSTIPHASDNVMASLLEQAARGEIQSLKEQFAAHRESEPPAAHDTTALEASLKAQIEAYKLDQERLPCRLHNALATKSLSPIKILPMKNRKFPSNFPSTRGEYEHLTKERYESLMESYEVPITGDTAAKREALRGFLGIPAGPIEKK
ncbi:hypothetical protein JB92DRAFT_3028213 [Gautieria morchelliformis]|nr:hypothetical protein JB92DRAFT_3028213 [Gautieria morchelliformis]